jgi:hypothetical protein
LVGIDPGRHDGRVGVRFGATGDLPEQPERVGGNRPQLTDLAGRGVGGGLGGCQRLERLADIV